MDESNLKCRCFVQAEGLRRRQMNLGRDLWDCRSYLFAIPWLWEWGLWPRASHPWNQTVMRMCWWRTLRRWRTLRSATQPHLTVSPQSLGSCSGLVLWAQFVQPSLEKHPHPYLPSTIISGFGNFWHNKLLLFFFFCPYLFYLQSTTWYKQVG